MKHALKVLIPLILIIALLVAACWFFIYQRPDLTMSVFSYWGDRFYDAGRYNRAEFFYSTAIKLAPNNEMLPSLLADSYVKDGNYTKAEYSLVSAITRNPNSVYLYAALSGAYVQQDKLLDAEQMLDRISNSEVKAKIDSLRPATPVISPESGYYSEYIDVSISAASGVIYSALNTDYPSMKTDAYTAPITLEGGETKIVAITVAENGLVSDAAYAGYTVGSVVEPVVISDHALDIYVREMLEKDAADELMSDELWEITEIDLPEDVKDLSDLRMFNGLLSLTIHSSSNLDLSILEELTTLKTLVLSGCTVSPAMTESICTLPDLEHLELAGCAISNINPLVGLSKLSYLDLTNNSVSDLTALSALSGLKDLYLTNNPVKSISYLNNCLQLERLHIENCGVSKLSSIAGNTSIQELYCSGNEIEDISVLEDCSSLSVIDITDNNVEDISVLAKLPALTVFIADRNQISSIPDFDEETSRLWKFFANDNKIESLEGLRDLVWLNYIHIDYNKVKDLSCVKDCSTLMQIDAWDNPLDLEKLPELESIGILITYNPNYVPPAEEPAAES
ncbi:MAG: leucine-rich repeat domain-containing protein [Clostridia bacterium]|nr:leucine-rich repeat domain-containing protein [Clostridia bacterium]